jgi:hypothetical protein
LLGFEEFIDVGLGKADRLGEVGDRGLFAIVAEVFGGGGNDLVADIVVRRPAGGVG